MNHQLEFWLAGSAELIGVYFILKFKTVILKTINLHQTKSHLKYQHQMSKLKRPLSKFWYFLLHSRFSSPPNPVINQGILSLIVCCLVIQALAFFVAPFVNR